MRASTEQTRRAITVAALSTFCERGFAVATLEEIGAAVGLTRGAVLHHFDSKTKLLAAVLYPLRAALVDLIASAEVDDPVTESQRLELLNRFADIFLEHRGAVRLLAHDVSARAALEQVDAWPMPADRLVTLLAGSRPTALTQVRVTAAIGAMVTPIASTWLDLDDVAARGELIGAAEAILAMPRSTASASAPGPSDSAALRMARLAKVAGR